MRVKTEKRRQEIIAIAKKAFAANGFSQTSMDSIAKTMGGSKATLYNYFPSKEAIYLAVLETTAAQITQAFNSLNKEEELKATLMQFGKKYLASICSPELVQIANIAHAEAMNSELGHYFYQHGPKKGIDDLEKFIHFHMTQQNLKSNSARVSAMQLIALLNAELKEPFSLGIIDKPDAQTIEDVASRAIESFLLLSRR